MYVPTLKHYNGFGFSHTAFYFDYHFYFGNDLVYF